MMLWLIPAICGLAAIVCAGLGIVRVLAARRIVGAHAERLRAALPLAVVDLSQLQSSLARIDAAAAAARVDVARAIAAIRAIAEGLQALRLREAVLALRVAGAAIRGLRALL